MPFASCYGGSLARRDYKIIIFIAVAKSYILIERFSQLSALTHSRLFESICKDNRKRKHASECKDTAYLVMLKGINWPKRHPPEKRKLQSC